MSDPIRQLDDESLRILREMVGDYKRRRAPESPTKRRYPRGLPGLELFHFTLTEDMSATSSNQASCTIYTADGATRTEYETGQTVYDPDNVYSSAKAGNSGPCILRKGKYYAVDVTRPDPPAPTMHVRPISLSGAMSGGEASCQFLDAAGGFGTAVDRFGAYENAAFGHTGYVGLVDGVWEIIDLGCDSVSDL